VSFASRVRKVPSHLVAVVALAGGIAAGGAWPESLAPVAKGTRALLELLILLVPVLIVGALSPAIASLVRRGLAGRFAAAVLLWFLGTTIVAAFLGIVIGAIAFPFGANGGTAASVEQAAGMLRELGFAGRVSVPIVAIAIAVALGVIGAKVERVHVVLKRVEAAIARLGSSIGYAMAPLILALGIMIGVTFGAQLGMAHYGTMVVYAASMALLYWVIWIFGVLRLFGGVKTPWRLLKEYFLPTALFAAGTSSSLATIPVNLAAAKRYGVRDEVADFVIPLGAIVHKEGSAMQYMAYAAFIAGSVFGLAINWPLMLLVWPFVVLYTMAAPGIPGAMGLGLWTGALFASLLGLEDPLRGTFVGTWVALASGIPDMFRTATNSTSEGFTTVLFSHGFDRYFAPSALKAGATEGSAAPGGERPQAGAPREG
jgi:Na+/H+-dicarboxylate symporter